MRSLINFTQDGGFAHLPGYQMFYKGKTPRDNSVQLEQMRIAEAERQRQLADQTQSRELEALASDPNSPVTSQAALARQQQLLQERKDKEARDRFTSARDTALAGARGTASSELQRRNLDASRYMPGLETEITRLAGTIPDLDQNPGSFFDPSFVDRVLNNEQTAARDRNNRNVRSAFAPGFERTAVGDTSDDAILDSILEGQYSDARGTIDRARSRGDLNDQGYNAALGELDTARGTGRTTLTGIGDTVLGRYRDELTGIANRANTAASGWSLGDTDFDVNPFTTDLSSTRTRQQGSLEGDVRGAVGGTQLFDIGSILSKGAKVGGPTSGAEPNDFVQSVLNRRRNTTDRGVGSSGVF